MINEEIRDREVRVVDQNGEQLGIMPTRQALMLAEERELDLVMVARSIRCIRQLPLRGSPVGAYNTPLSIYVPCIM